MKDRQKADSYHHLSLFEVQRNEPKVRTIIWETHMEILGGKEGTD